MTARWVTGHFCSVNIWKLELKSPVCALWLRYGWVSHRKVQHGCLWLLSAVPAAPRVAFQLPRSRPAYPGFSTQCEQRDGWHGQQDSQQVQEPEAAVDGGSQRPPQRMWHQVAAALLAQPLLGDGGAADGSLATIQKVLQVGSSRLLNEVARTAAGGGL